MNCSKDIKNSVNYFIRKISKLNHCNLKFFYNNLSTLTINEYIENSIFSPNTSNYNLKKNKIKLINKSDLYHELFHVASSYYNPYINSIAKSGFYFNGVGDGINEGYTELLVRRYFKKDKDSYPIESKIAYNLELIVGEMKMEKLYFKADFDGLINELSKYMNKDKVIYYIKIIDLISMNIDYNHKEQKYKDELIENIKDVNLFLLNCYTNKLILDYQNKLIDKKTMFIKLKKYVKGLKYVYSPYNVKYYILEDDTILKQFNNFETKVLHI